MKHVSFYELVKSRYLDAGFTKLQAFSKVYLDSGVCITTLRAAFGGSRVTADSVERLAAWASKTHRVELDELAMLKAPEKPARSIRNASERAKDALNVVVHAAGMPASWHYCVSLSLTSDAWTVSAQPISQMATATVAQGPSLVDVLSELRARISGPA